jgi:N-acetylglucosamine-6-phosphate deacetylase
VQVTCKNGQIQAVHPLPDTPSLPWLMPVLVDLQHNGALGNYYPNLDENAADVLGQIATHQRRHGVGRCLLTLTTADVAPLKVALHRIDAALSESPGLAALYFGLFHEGIFISPRDGWRGAHPPQWIKPPDYDLLRELDGAAGGRIHVVNVAPEESGGLDFISDAIADGKIVALGHCAPDHETIAEAIQRGATWVTHFGNGAASSIHRFDNPFWGFLAHEELALGLICDGYHLPPELVRTALKCKTPKSCFMVSDASGYAGCAPGRYERDGGRTFDIEPGGFVHLVDSECLMGAWYQLDRGVEFLVTELAMDFHDAWAQCSTIPADLAGITLPTIAEGEEASFVLARMAEGELVIEQSVHHGVPYLDVPITPRGPRSQRP